MKRFARRIGRLSEPSDVQGAVLRALRVGRKKPTTKAVARWRSLVSTLLPLGGVSTRNKLSLFVNGDAAFSSMWSAIANAQKRVWLETYTLSPDAVGLRTLALLEDAARRGCDVRLLYDSVGSWQIEERHVTALRALGAQARAFHPLRADWPWRWTAYLHRNHRKTLCIDDKVAYCGGMNVGAQYCGPTLGNSYFSDVHVKVEGLASADLRKVFLDSLYEAEKYELATVAGAAPFSLRQWLARRVRFERVWRFLGAAPVDEAALVEDKQDRVDGGALIDPVTARDSLVQVLVSNVRREKMHIQRALPLAIRHARELCYIASPYFLPPRRVRNALINAAKRGVDVRIVTAGRTDVALAQYAGRHLYSLLMSYGIKIYELKQSALHAKLCVLDNAYTTIGSFNLDVMSHTRNLEVSMHVLDPRLAQAAHEQMQRYIAGSVLVTATDLKSHTWYQKVLHWLAYQVARLPQVYRSPVIGDDVS